MGLPLPVNQRPDIARRNKADLFVSIHADAFTTPQPSGASVWVLSMKRVVYLADWKTVVVRLFGVPGFLKLQLFIEKQFIFAVLLEIKIKFHQKSFILFFN